MTGKKANGFSSRYGAWALIAGASEGLGAAYARGLARRGLNVALVARREPLLEELAAECRETFGVQTRRIVCDLASADAAQRVTGAVSGLEIGLLVYNAGFSPMGQFSSMSSSELMRVVDLNVRGPTALLGAFLPAMEKRGRGGAILMASLAGNQGSPGIAAYAASKAFNRVLAEGLWSEFKGRGVDIVACLPGAVRTPGYLRSAIKDAPGTMDPEAVAEVAIRALGKGPTVVPGLVNRMAAQLLGRLLPRRAAIGIMGRAAAP